MKTIRRGKRPPRVIDYHYECYTCKGVYQPESDLEVRIEDDQRETLYWPPCPECGQQRSMKRIMPATGEPGEGV